MSSKPPPTPQALSARFTNGIDIGALRFRKPDASAFRLIHRTRAMSLPKSRFALASWAARPAGALCEACFNVGAKRRAELNAALQRLAEAAATFVDASA